MINNIIIKDILKDLDVDITRSYEEYVPFWKMLINFKFEIINSFSRVNGYHINNGNIEIKNE